MDYSSLPWMSLPSLLTPATATALDPFFDAFTSASDGATLTLAPSDLSSSSSTSSVVPASTLALGSTDSAPFSSALSASLAATASSSSSSYPIDLAQDDRRASTASSRSSRATSPPPFPKRAPEPSHDGPAAKRARPSTGESSSSKPTSKRRPRKMTDKRREQNRLAQKNLRARRAAQYEEYHDRAEALEKENSELRALISALRSENGSLRALVPQEFQSALISIPSAPDSDHTADYYSTDEAGSPFSAYL